MPHLMIGNGPQMYRKLSVILIALCCLINAGCYHVRVLAPHPDPATEYKHKTVNTLAWGLVKEDKTADDCTGSNALDEVRVTSNLGLQRSHGGYARFLAAHKGGMALLKTA